MLWVGTLFTFVAFFMSTVVQSVVAFELTGANKAVGLVVFGQGSAMVLLGPLGGALADRWPKRRVIAVCQVGITVVFFTMSWVLANGLITVLLLVFASMTMGASFAFQGPSRQAFVVELVSEERRGNAIALSQVANSASRVVGPATAGGMLAWSWSGATGAYAAMGILYAISASSLFFLPRSRSREGPRTRVLDDVLGGLRYVRDHGRLRALVLLFVLVIMVGYPYVTVLPGLVENELGRDARSIGLLHGFAAVGALVAGLAVARYADSPRATAIFSLMGLGFGASLIVVAMVPTYEVALFVMLGIGALSGGFQTLSGAIIVRETEPAFIGRVMSVTMLAFGAFGLMALPLGFLADAVGERAALVAMGVAVLAIVMILRAVLRRTESRADALEPRALEPESLGREAADTHPS